jgi:cytochrome P450
MINILTLHSSLITPSHTHTHTHTHLLPPNRWADTDPDAVKLKELSFPFSSGKRACIGQNLALLELKLVLANLVYSYDFELVSEISEMYYITLKPLNANFKITRRP